jgi:hypothetical protein
MTYLWDYMERKLWRGLWPVLFWLCGLKLFRELGLYIDVTTG